MDGSVEGPASLWRDPFIRGVSSFAVVTYGVVLALWPVHLSSRDAQGYHISCGSGVVSDYEQAVAADAADRNSSISGGPGAESGTDDVNRCRSLVWERRLWAGLVVMLGLAGGALAVLRAMDRDAGNRCSPASDISIVDID